MGSPRQVHRFALLAAACAWASIASGALVTSLGAGLSIPDWPLAYGRVLPAASGLVLYSFLHRTVAAGAAVLAWALAAWVWRANAGTLVKACAAAGALAMLFEIGVGVLELALLLPKPAGIVHAILGDLSFCALAAAALATSPSWNAGPVLAYDSGWPSLRALCVFTVSVLALEAGFGAAYRHRAFSVIPHICGALLVTAVVLVVSIFVLSQHAANPGLRRFAVALIVLSFVEIFLGIGAYVARLENAGQLAFGPVGVAITALHAAVGPLALAAGVALTLQVARNVRKPAVLSFTSQGLTTAS
jgi:cytochrome c oxidase assembly protein subunit 15